MLNDDAGVHCETRIYDCAEHSCANNATCRPAGPLNYTCQCGPDHYGDLCQLNIGNFYMFYGRRKRWGPGVSNGWRQESPRARKTLHQNPLFQADKPVTHGIYLENDVCVCARVCIYVVCAQGVDPGV